MVLWIILGVIVLLVVWVLGLYNGLVRANNKVSEAFSTMDVYLKKRWDMIPNLVETVKGYAKHEKGTLEDVVKLRSGAYDSMSSDEKIEANKELSQGINKIMVLAEAYPELKANENFNNLSEQLERVEDDIANSRKYYNGVIRDFNDKVVIFPNNIVAGLFGFKPKSMFELSDTAERENVKVEF